MDVKTPERARAHQSAARWPRIVWLVLLLVVATLGTRHYMGSAAVSVQGATFAPAVEYTRHSTHYDDLRADGDVVELYRRKDKSTSSSSTSASADKPTPFYNQAGVRFVFVLAAVVVLNMLAIVVHHVYQKLSGRGTRYKNVEQVISPF
ncbi:hypothetical protein ABC855_g2561 [[Candida] zeylanoides]